MPVIPDRWVSRLGELGAGARVFARAGLLTPVRPDRVLLMAGALRRWGATIAGGFAVNAARHPDRAALVDDRGPLTFAALHRRSNALANGLLASGIRQGSTVAVMCRNHRGFLETTAALAKLGANTLYLNTGFGSGQLRDVAAREQAAAIVFDDEFARVVQEAAPGVPTFDARGLDTLALAADESEPPVPERPGRTIILTSGTTGIPRGVSRAESSGLAPLVALLSVLPLRAEETTVVAAPLFHSWGFGHLALGLLLGSTAVVHRRFDPVATLEAVDRHRASVLVAVPAMLQRILGVPEATRRSFDTSSLRAVLVSGSTLPRRLAPRFMDEFGDVLYNLYGSSEVAYATVATPDDLRVAPNTAGRPLRATTVAILGAEGHPVPAGEQGRIFVGNEMVFEGYTGGGTKATAHGLMSTGDVGRFDAGGRLTVEGREDEMIVSGGENVVPEEVESHLTGHESIAEAAVVGVPDDEFGQRLKAFVVLEPGTSLTAAEVREHVRSGLARYKVPRDIEFVDTLPRNLTGKIVRHRLTTRPPPA